MEFSQKLTRAILGCATDIHLVPRAFHCTTPLNSHRSIAAQRRAVAEGWMPCHTSLERKITRRPSSGAMSTWGDEPWGSAKHTVNMWCFVLHCYWYCIVLYCIISYHIVCHIILHCVILYCIMLYHSVWYCVILYDVVSYYTISYHILLCHIILYHVILYYNIFYCNHIYIY